MLVTIIALLSFPAATQNDHKEKSEVQHSRNISNTYHHHILLKLYCSIKMIFFKMKGAIKSLYSWRWPALKGAMFKLLPQANQ